VTVSLAALLVYAVGSVQSLEQPAAFADPRTSPPQPAPRFVPDPRPPGRPPEPGVSPVAFRIAQRGDERVRLLLRLDEAPLASMERSADPAERRTRARRIRSIQDRAIADVEKLGGEALARLRNATSGVVVSIPAKLAPEVAELPGVVAILPVHDARLFTESSVPWLGVPQFWSDFGSTGEGTTVAVIDSGVDFTHANFGGPGTPSAYAFAYYGTDQECVTGQELVCANRFAPDPQLFGPNAPKVKGGFDFVGELWDGTSNSPPEEPDPNPIDRNGHGTQVAAVAVGLGYPAGVDGDGNPHPAQGPGVAPGADLWVFKACSAVADSCSGAAILSAFDAALDLDGNAGTFDPADVVNFSGGLPYGQPEDALLFVADQAASQGVIVVAAAGTLGDRPLGASSPAVALGAIGVGGVQHPDQTLSKIDLAGEQYDLLRMLWSPAPGNAFTGELEWQFGSPATALGCNDVTGGNPFQPGSLKGKIVLVDRGGCTFGEKVANAQAAGAIAAILAENRVQSVNELPNFDGSGGHTATIPAYGTTLTTGLSLKGLIGTTAVLDPANDSPLEFAMEGGSSRGPRFDGAIKPDLVAPAGAFTGLVGTGSQTGFMGGTSMAAPHFTGIAALVIATHRERTNWEIKTALMNCTDDVFVGLLPPNRGVPGSPAPVTWAGAGLPNILCAADALDNGVIFWTEPIPGVEYANQASMSFGYMPFTDPGVIAVPYFYRNFSGQPITYTRNFTHRDPAESNTLNTVVITDTIPADGIGSKVITVTVNADQLPDWVLDIGANGYDGHSLDLQELDGYVYFDIAGVDKDPRMPWQLLPQKAADLSGTFDAVPQTQVLGNVRVGNGSSLAAGTFEIFQLAVEGLEQYPGDVGDCVAAGFEPGCNESPIDIKEVGIRDRFADLDGDNIEELWIELALTVWDSPYRSSQWPVQIDWRLDTNLDGVDDYIVFTSPTASDGRNGVWLYSFANNETQFSAWTDATFFTQDWILAVQADALGLSPGDAYNWYVLVREIYYTNTVWDCEPFPTGADPCGTDSYTVTLDIPRFGVGDENMTLTVTHPVTATVPVTGTLASAAASPSEQGLLLIYRNSPIGQGSTALPFVVEGVDDDGDGKDNAGDCDPADPTVFAVPPEVFILEFDGTHHITWSVVAADSGAGTVYDVYAESGGFGAVGEAPDGRYVISGTILNSAPMDQVVQPGQLQRSFVRARGPCGPGTLGFGATGERMP
jgi:subtilisin family serine protease